MPRATVKQQYGPTLAALLAPRWQAASRRARGVALAACAALVAGAVGVVLALLNASYSHGPPVPFSFSYRGLYRAAPEPGGYVRVQSHRADGALEYSFAVDPLKLPPYSGPLGGEMPIYATAYERALARRSPRFELRGEGRTHISTDLSGYQVAYTVFVEGQEMYGRNVLLAPEQAGAREGVVVVMLAQPGASQQVLSPLEVATTGVLLRPLKSFSLG